MTQEKIYCEKCKREVSLCTCSTSDSQNQSSERKMFTIPKREFPNLMVGDAECHICGMPLKDNLCPMCGWSPKAKAEKGSYRCPFCGSELDNDDKCPSCTRSLAELEQERQEIDKVRKSACPICLKEISIEEDACPHCGARIWFDIAKELRALDVTRCPRCQSEVSENIELCPNCGFDIWLGSGDGLENAVLELIKEAESELELGTTEGTRLAKFYTILEEAKRKFELGRYRRAELLARLVSKGAKTMTLQFKVYKDGLRKAERLFGQIVEFSEGSEVQTILESAKKMADEGQYKSALRLTVRASIVAEKLKRDRPLGVIDDYK